MSYDRIMISELCIMIPESMIHEETKYIILWISENMYLFRELLMDMQLI